MFIINDLKRWYKEFQEYREYLSSSDKENKKRKSEKNPPKRKFNPKRTDHVSEDIFGEKVGGKHK